MKSCRLKLIPLSLAAALSTVAAQAGWQDLVKGALDSGAVPGTNSAVSSLSQTEMVSGLKEALQQGVVWAVDLLGKDGGFLNDPSVFIPMPGLLKTIGDGLRSIGQGPLVDQFEATMNGAAESSMKEALSIFSDAIRNMSVKDAEEILSGPDDAATKYFRRQSEERLRSAMTPIVKSATDEAGVTAAYKKVMDSAGFAASFVDTRTLDLDAYVTDKAIDGLFLKIAEEEKRIRENPLARSTDLLKKVFENVR
jgi:ribosomal protein L22